MRSVFKTDKNESSNSSPLWLQAALLFSLLVTLVITILLTNNYIYNKNKVFESYVANTKTVLNLEMDNMTQYIRELTSFAIQPCYDTRFTRLIESNSAITDDDIDYIKNQMGALYYTRNDLNSYELYLMNQHIKAGRSRGAQHISSSYFDSPTDRESKIFNECANAKYFLYVDSSDNSSDFFTFYHSIIQIKNKASLAFVKCDIDKDFINAMIKGCDLDDNEILLLYNSLGDLLFSSDTSINNYLPESLSLNNADSYSATFENGKKYLVTSCHDNLYGLTLISLNPYDVLSSNVFSLLKTTIFQGSVVWIVFIVIVIVSSRSLMLPLDKLADHMKIIGEGNFDTKIDIGGSSEIENLGNSFNYMSEHIQQLITENYLVRLNEQTAKLIALEAQINPHFLYNTLQAISTEALVNDQNQIHEMVISLASILRYSIKGGDLVTLADECAHVKKYFYLQKIRMGDNLEYSIDISEEANTCLIPKISLQTLVENSIVHGINGEITSIAIKVKAYVKDDRVFIDITDDGCGMTEETLEYLNDNFASSIISPTRSKGVGLVNIHERLKILYKNEGSMTIESKPSEGTTIKMSIPVMRGFENESTDNR